MATRVAGAARAFAKVRRRHSKDVRLKALSAFTVLALALGSVSLPASCVAQTLSDKVGQLLMVGFPGQSPNAAPVKALRREISDGRVGGVILFRENIANPRQLRRLTEALQASAPVPLFVAIDQEGGNVQRIGRRNGFDSTPSAAWVAANRSEQGAHALYGAMARKLADGGVNLNLAPVVDLNTYPRNPIIGRQKRSFGRDPETVTGYARAFVAAHKREGVMTALKHFPGHGSSRKDSHLGFADVSTTWQPTELLPYQDPFLLDLASMVMVAHVTLGKPALPGGEALPATLSPRVVDGLLRSELGYSGVVISDDMDMGAIRALMSREEAAVRAIEAGVDILIYSKHEERPAQLARSIHGALLNAAERDPTFRARVDAAYDRVMLLKEQLRPAAAWGSAAPTGVAPGSSDTGAPAAHRGPPISRVVTGPVPLPRQNPKRSGSTAQALRNTSMSVLRRLVPQSPPASQ